MMQRTTITLTEADHRYLSGLAHERSVSTGKRVSLNSVIAEIVSIGVEEMRKVDAAIASLAAGGRTARKGKSGGAA